MTTNPLKDQFLGIPQEIWRYACIYAEELLYEEQVGQHIIGLYPYNITENSLISVLCLYIDAPEYLLNPFYKMKELTSMRHEDSMNIEVTFINLFDWIKQIDKRISDIHTTVCFDKSLYQDESVDPLIELVAQYINKPNPNYFNQISKFIINYYKALL